MSRSHKRPVEPSPSRLLVHFAEEIAAKARGVIIDVPCGYGRNAAYLSSYGLSVICIDNCHNALETIKAGRGLSTTASYKPELLVPMNLDLVGDLWPFGEETIGAAINVHYYTPLLFGNLIRSISIDGYLLLETIDGHGTNYLELPQHGFVMSNIIDSFEIRHYKEKKQANGTSSVKCVAIKRRTLVSSELG